MQTRLDKGGGTPDIDIVVAAFAVVLVSVIWVGIPTTLRDVGVVHVLDVLGNFFGPVVHRR